METLNLELPAMYADHHVIEVRRILYEITGVDDVYASSSFRSVEVKFDSNKVSAEEITSRLDDAGYIGDLPSPVEAGAAEYHTENGSSFIRHTSVYENTRHTVSFAQSVSYSGRPLWPCPGLGPIQAIKQEEA